MILFGGMQPITSDTWEYDANYRVWKQLGPENQGSVPDPRCHHTLVSNSTNENIVLFGGFSFVGRFNDVWRFDPDSELWLELLPTGLAPLPRCLHTAVHIGSRNEMLMYGGVQGGGNASGDYFEDTYVLDLANNEWILVNASGPGKLRGAISFYSTVEDAVYLWGGKQVGPYPTTLWRFDVDQRVWEAVPTAGDVPPGREDPAFFWDDTRQELHIFSGRNDNLAEALLNDEYKLDLATTMWQALSVEGAPPARWRASVAFDPATSMGVMFGGWTDFGGQDAFNDTWMYDAVNSAWSEETAFQLPPGEVTAFDASGIPIGSVGSHAAIKTGRIKAEEP